MSYPTSLDSFTDPIATNTLNSPSHSGIETAQNTALAALETKVGVTGSAITSSLDYQVTNTSSSNPGHKHTFTSLSDFTVTTPVSGDLLQYSGTKWVNLPSNTIPLKFGGTGADGALTLSSGTTTIDLGSAAFVIKNYTSISITGSGSIAFSNPAAAGTYVVLKSQGNVTITTSGSVSLVGQGGASTGAGQALVGTAPGAGGTGAGAGGTAGTVASGYGLTTFLYPKFIPFLIGAGGGNGSAGGAGGRGGGAIYIECGGALNFTTATITVAGGVGTVASNCGGGGGGGGSVVILYNTLTANSGTITKTGGAGGVGNSANGGGGGGSSTVGVAGGTGSGLGGAGGDGFSLVAKNTEFA